MRRAGAGRRPRELLRELLSASPGPLRGTPREATSDRRATLLIVSKVTSGAHSGARAAAQAQAQAQARPSLSRTVTFWCRQEVPGWRLERTTDQDRMPIERHVVDVSDLAGLVALIPLGGAMRLTPPPRERRLQHPGLELLPRAPALARSRLLRPEEDLAGVVELLDRYLVVTLARGARDAELIAWLGR